MKKNILSYILLLFSILPIYGQEPYLENLFENKRDRILIEKAKEVIMKYGPGYYRDYRPPIIKKDTIGENENEDYKPNIGRTFYSVTFLYDPEKEQLCRNEAAIVLIWGDTGKPYLIIFGNCYGLYDLDKKEVNTLIPYEAVPKEEPFDWSIYENQTDTLDEKSKY